MTERHIIASFKVEKGIPVPPRVRGVGGFMPYPFLEMEVGDSFWVAKKNPPVTGHNAIMARNKGWKFTFRREDHEEIKGFRIWRIA